MDGPAAPGKQSIGASLDESVAVVEVANSRAGEMLTKAAGALGALYPFHVTLKKLSPGSIFHDIDAIWSPRLILSNRPSVLLPVR